MSKTITIIIIGFIILVIVTAVVMNIKTAYEPISITDIPPLVMSDKVIKESLKEEFLPSVYTHKITPYTEIVDMFKNREVTSAPLPPFSGKVTDLYLTSWPYENAYFTSYVGYDKNSGQFVGYNIAVRVKEPRLDALQLAQKYFKTLPEKVKWRHGISSETETVSQDELYSIIYRQEQNKVFIKIYITHYSQATTVYWPNKELVQKIAVLDMEVFTPNNPKYSEVEKTQNLIMEAYNEK